MIFPFFWEQSLRLARCIFNQFLHAVIVSSNVLPQNHLSHLNLHHYHESFSEQNLIIENCKFNNCRNRDFHGGAIFAICDSIIKDSTFSKCFAGYGGALSVFSNTIIINTCFYKCFSHDGGAFLIKFGSLIFNSSMISYCSASGTGGAIKTCQLSDAQQRNINYSYCSSVSQSSVSMIDSISLLISQSIYSFCKSYESYGAICVTNRILNIDIANCIFSELKANHLSTALHITGSFRSPFSLNNCVFYHSEKLLPSIYCSRIRQFIVSGCVFSNEEKSEIAGQNPSVENDNRFNTSNDADEFINIPKRQFFFNPYPYVLTMDYVNEIIRILQTAFQGTIIMIFTTLIAYEIFFIYKKTHQQNKRA